MSDRVCRYCGSPLDATPQVPPSDEGGTTVCQACLSRIVAEKGQSLRDFLDAMTEPVFLVDANCRILAASKEVRRMVKKEVADVEGALVGEVLECEHARTPGGCGQPVHCRSSTIRRCVATTFKTGQACKQVSAYADLGTVTGVTSIEYLISTESVGGVVLLRIEHVPRRRNCGTS